MKAKTTSLGPALLLGVLGLGCQSPSAGSKATSTMDDAVSESAPSDGTANATAVAASADPGPPSLPMPSGIAFAEVTHSRASVWSRCDREATLRVVLKPATASGTGSLHADAAGPLHADGTGLLHADAAVDADHDFAAQLDFEGLLPATTYRASAWCLPTKPITTVVPAGAASGEFKTAPRPDDSVGIRFAWGGDLGGQNVCRDKNEGYPIFTPLRDGRYDFFVALGDLIYADTRCSSVGALGNAQVPRTSQFASTLAAFHEHWRYNREDEKYRAFLESTPYYTIWDDHEVLNDFGPKTDVGRASPYPRGVHLLPMGLQAMRDYNPIVPSSRLYRQYRWGQHVELFFIDTRQYRDENTRTDSPNKPKQMLGSEQVQWLLDALSGSNATWKFVISSVPISIPTGLHSGARDGFANYDGTTGFELELKRVFETMRDRKLTHTVWLTTDVHIAAGFSYVPFPDSPEFKLHEFVSGPMSAGFFPRNIYDKTFRPMRHFTWAVDNVSTAKDFQSAKELFNYGEVAVTQDGKLRIDIVNALGRRVAGMDIAR